MSNRWFILMLLPVTAIASDYHSPRTAGLGGAGHAAPLLNDGLYLNPAMMALLPAYSVSASNDSASGPNGSEPKGMVQNASIQDGTSPDLQAGLGYTRKTYGKEVHVGASARILQSYGVGIGGKFLFGSDSRFSTQDATVSAVGAPVPWGQVGLIVDNAVEGTKTRAWGLYREVTLGAKVNVQKLLLLYADPHIIPGKPGDTFGYEVGAELAIMTDLFIRGGLSKNSFQPMFAQYGKGFGFGFGWAFPRISFDAALTRTTEPFRTNGVLFSATIL